MTTNPAFPTMNPFLTHGAISWSEYLAADPAPSLDFYAKLLGWQHYSMPMEMEGGGTYHVATMDGTNAAGLMKRPHDDIPQCWGFYVTVHDVRALVAELGPRLVVPVTDTPMGPFCGIMDPQGAVLYALEYAAPDKESSGVTDFASAFTQHGLFSWFELSTTDGAAAADFYSRLFGWEMSPTETPFGLYRRIMVGDVGIGGIMESLPAGVPPHWHGYVTVDDVDQRAAAAASLGATVNAGPFDVPEVGRMAHILDPFGAPLALITYQDFSTSPDC